MTDFYSYSLFGLHIQSEIALPELASAEGDGVADVVVRNFQPGRDQDQLPGSEVVVEGVARFEVRQGREILVEPDAGGSDKNVRLFLLGSAMGLLLHQRGDLPLHANAVEIDGKAFAFMGPPGSGKSTLAGTFHDRGYGVIADDVCVIRFCHHGTPIAFPGIPRLRLWENALTASGRAAGDFQLSYAGDEKFRKFDVPVDAGRGSGPIPLSAIFLLAEADTPTIARLEGIQAIEAVYANTYRGAFAAREGMAHAHWQSSIALVRTTPVLQFGRRLGFDLIDGQMEYLLNAITGADALP